MLELANLFKGQALKVREDLVVKQYGEVTVVREMLPWRGKLVHIKSIEGNNITLEESNWYWSVEMFEDEKCFNCKKILINIINEYKANKSKENKKINKMYLSNDGLYNSITRRSLQEKTGYRNNLFIINNIKDWNLDNEVVMLNYDIGTKIIYDSEKFEIREERPNDNRSNLNVWIAIKKANFAPEEAWEKIGELLEELKDDDRFKELFIEQSEEDVIIKKMTKIREDKIEETESTIETYKHKVNENKDILRRLVEQLRKKEQELETLKTSKDAEAEKIIKEIKLIKNHPHCKKLTLTDSGIQIYLGKTNIYDNDDIYYLGNVNVDIPFDPILDMLWDNDNPRRSYWTNNDIAPHIDGECGRACYGNAIDMVSQYHSMGEYYALYLVLLGYIQSVDTTDCAGRNVVSWDRVDSEGNIIEEGHYREAYICHVCDEDIEEDDYIICEDCANYCHTDCSTYLERYNKWVCNDCIEDYYTRCDECEEYVLNDNIEYVEDKNLCSECLNDIAVKCDDCFNEIKDSEEIEVL